MNEGIETILTISNSVGRPARRERDQKDHPNLRDHKVRRCRPSSSTHPFPTHPACYRHRAILPITLPTVRLRPSTARARIQCRAMSPRRRLILTRILNREDDANWPKKNIVGKQELEIRIGNEHIAFEVCHPYHPCSFFSHCST
jgi:hypothetical protein